MFNSFLSLHVFFPLNSEHAYARLDSLSGKRAWPATITTRIMSAVFCYAKALCCPCGPCSVVRHPPRLHNFICVKKNWNQQSHASFFVIILLLFFFNFGGLKPWFDLFRWFYLCNLGNTVTRSLEGMRLDTLILFWHRLFWTCLIYWSPHSSSQYFSNFAWNWSFASRTSLASCRFSRGLLVLPMLPVLLVFSLPNFFSERVAVGGWIWCKNLLKHWYLQCFPATKALKPLFLTKNHSTMMPPDWKDTGRSGQVRPDLTWPDLTLACRPDLTWPDTYSIHTLSNSYEKRIVWFRCNRRVNEFQKLIWML